MIRRPPRSPLFPYTPLSRSPPATLLSRTAPTERPTKTAQPLRGVVHDPTARFMGGVAGHAGMFSTADDLARFAQMMINGGELERSEEHTSELQSRLHLVCRL